jgi:hypothetical protein
MGISWHVWVQIVVRKFKLSWTDCCQKVVVNIGVISIVEKFKLSWKNIVRKLWYILEQVPWSL